MSKDELIKMIASSVQPNADGYVISKEIEIFCRRTAHPELFEEVCRHFVANGIDVVDEDYENIYRRNRGLDLGEETDEVSDVVTKDLGKKYDSKIMSGYKGLLESHGLARGILYGVKGS